MPGLLHTGCLIIVGDEASHHSVASKFAANDGAGALCCHSVKGVESVEQGADNTTLWSSCVESGCVGPSPPVVCLWGS